MNDIYEVIGTHTKHYVDISRTIGRHFPNHQSFVAWRDAGGHCPAGVLASRAELEEALTEIAIRRGGNRISAGIVEFDDEVTAERFLGWCRPE
jgi:hypothetical protein